MKTKDEKRAEEDRMQRIYDQVYDALNNARDNDYPHEYDRKSDDIVLEINDWSGILDFDHNSAEDLGKGMDAVFDWRRDNPQ